MKVRIRKALPHETPSYKSKLSGFLTKAAKGMEVQTRDESSDLVDFIIASFESGTEADDIISTLTQDYNIATDKAKYYTKYVQDNYLPDPLLEDDEEDKVKINDDKIKNDKVEDIAEDADPNSDLYNMEDSGISGGDYGDGLDLNPDEIAKFGGSKSKTIKYFKKLLKAKEGLEAPEKNSQPNIRGTVNNPSAPFNNNKGFVSAINNQVKDSFYNTQAEKMYEQQANNEFGFGGNRRIKRANKAFFGTKTAPVGVDADYKFGLLGNLKEGTIKWDPNMAINMMQQFGVNQRPQGFGYDPGYGGGSWSNSYNTGWERTTTPGTIVREKIIKSINNAADPTKINNVALNNKPNGTANTNTEWQNSSRKAEKASVDAAGKAFHDYDSTDNHGYVPSGMPDFEFTPGIHEDRKWSSPINQVDFINTNDKIYNEKGKIDWKLYNNLSQEEKDKLNQESYLQKDSKGNEYSVMDAYGTPEFETELNRLQGDYINKGNLYEFKQRFSPNVDPNVPSVWSPYTEPIEEDGGFVDPSQMQPGVLQKFLSGGYDDITQEDIDFTNSKNTTGSYREGGIKKFAGDEEGSEVDSFNEGYTSDAEEQFGIDRQANKEAYRKQVAEGKTRDKYDPNVNYTGTTNTKTNTYNNQGSNQGFNQGFSQGSNQGWYDPRQAAFAIPNRGQGRDGSFKNMLSQFMPVTNDMTWYNQTAGPLGAIKEGYAPNQLKYSKQRKTDGTWAERKLGFNKDKFVDVSYTKLGANDKPGVGVYAPGQGVNANMKPGTSSPGTSPGTSSDTQDIKKFQDSQKAQGKIWDEQTQKWVSGTKGPAYEGFNADSNGNTIPNYLDPTSPDVMPGSNPATKPVNSNLAYGGYMPNDYYAYSGYLPEAQFGKVGPFMTNDTDCTDQQKKDPQSPCYDSKFAIPAFARPGATIQEMMGIDNINCSEEDKLNPESDCYVDPNPESITKRFKVNKAKTVNFGAIGAGVNLAGNAIGALGESLASNTKGNTNMGKFNNSMNRVPKRQTVDTGLTTQEGWDPNAGYDSTGRMTAGAAKGGSVNNEGDITYMSSKQIKEFLKNGGQLEFQ